MQEVFFFLLNLFLAKHLQIYYLIILSYFGHSLEFPSG